MLQFAHVNREVLINAKIAPFSVMAIGRTGIGQLLFRSRTGLLTRVSDSINIMIGNLNNWFDQDRNTIEPVRLTDSD